ncbi:MAG: thioredoxin family protein [bacterium]|nr:thioredoxin family protein [bacterium]
MMRRITNWFIVALSLLFILPEQAHAGEKELVMFGSRSCVYCQIFNREVRPNYRWSVLGHKAPLREINIDRHGTGGYPLRRIISVTPTFVMFTKGREVARIRGYPGKKNFYKMVKQILKKVK